MAGMSRSRRIIVRTALVTSSTFAAIVGAQSLAVLDQAPSNPSGEGNLEPIIRPMSTNPPTAIPSSATAPTDTVSEPIIEVAPSITILRHPGQSVVTLEVVSPTSPSDPGLPATTFTIQPPSPVQIAAPDPVVVQGEAPPPVIISVPVAVPVQQVAQPSTSQS